MEMSNLLIAGIIILLLAINVLFFQHERRWNKIQERYLFTDKTFWGVKVKSREVAINGKSIYCPVKIMVSRNGLFLKPYFPQNIFSRSVLVPWADFFEVTDIFRMTKKMKRLTLKGTYPLTIDVSIADFYKIVKYINRLE
jgi:hypothetical protein